MNKILSVQITKLDNLSEKFLRPQIRAKNGWDVHVVLHMEKYTLHILSS